MDGGRQFEIVCCLGRGGFGEVYRAVMSSPGGLASDVAIKVLRRDLDPRGQAVRRLRDEGRVLARLHHPTILKVHDLLVLDGRVSLVTELVDGDDLGRLFPAPISPRALVEAIGHVASALDAAWNAPVEGSDQPLRLVHRDIKPSNIRVSRHGEVKLLDFGIARADSVAREARTQTDMLVGSPAYMAPERYVDPAVRPESDVFSLGATLYEGLTGERFTDDLPVPMLATLAIDEARYRAFLAKRLAKVPDVPRAFLDLLRDTLAYDPDDRPTASALAKRCELLADDLPGASLARFCRERDWVAEAEEVGELDGRTLTEGTLVQPAAPHAPASAPPATVPRVRSRRVGFLAAGLGTLGLAVVALGTLGVLGGLVIGWNGLPGPAPEPAPVAAPRAAPESARPAPDLAPGPAAPPSPVRSPVPVPAPSPVPSPSPVRSPVTPPPAAEPTVPPPGSPGAAEPSPPPVAVAPATGRVTVVGEASVVLSSGGQTFVPPGDVPVGTYEITATFPGAAPVKGKKSLVVEPGGIHELRCSARMMTCDPK